MHRVFVQGVEVAVMEKSDEGRVNKVRAPYHTASNLKELVLAIADSLDKPYDPALVARVRRVAEDIRESG